jgi:hypothetical protein
MGCHIIQESSPKLQWLAPSNLQRTCGERGEPERVDQIADEGIAICASSIIIPETFDDLVSVRTEATKSLCRMMLGYAIITNQGK